MPSVRTIAVVAGTTLGVIFLLNNVPQLGRLVKGN